MTNDNSDTLEEGLSKKPVISRMIKEKLKI